MARSIQTIQNQILAAIAADPNLSALNSTSQTAIYNLWTYIIATSMATEEGLNDAFVSQVQSIANVLPPATSQWIQAKAFAFQYSSTNPQVIQFNTTTLVPGYATVNTTYQIITNCSINQVSMGNIVIKVAKGSATTPVQLATGELQAFQYYMNQIKPCGIIYNCVSLPSDKLFSQFTITYYAAYSATIQASLLSAYTSYLQGIDFGGMIKLVDITLALRNVTGVIDVVCNNMQARADSVPFGTGTNMVLNNTVLSPEYTTAAGYIIDETTAGSDFLTNLTLIPQ